MALVRCEHCETPVEKGDLSPCCEWRKTELLKEALQDILDSATERIGYYGHPQTVVDADAVKRARDLLETV